jgi:hypothetical protein
MIIGIANDGSGQSDREDLMGEAVSYTHNSLFLGCEDKTGRLFFAEQFGSQIRLVTDHDYYRAGLTPVEILAPMKKRSNVEMAGLFKA